MNIAILIDAENVEPACADLIFSYAGSVGTVTVREIYGAGIALNEWAEPILRYAIHTNMTLKPNRYKNSSDIALVIGAMDLLARRDAVLSGMARQEGLPGASGESVVDTVIIASSDSDFSALAIRLRTAGIEVVGMGNREKTNPSWPTACSTFLSFNTLSTRQSPELPPQQAAVQAPALPALPAPQLQQSAPQQAAAQPRKPESAPTHSARVDIIRSFLSAQLAAHSGRISSVVLFGLLNELPDYRMDQKGSNRKPLDYLARQYGDVLKVEKNPDGTIWFYAPGAEPAAEAKGAPEEREKGKGKNKGKNQDKAQAQEKSQAQAQEKPQTQDKAQVQAQPQTQEKPQAQDKEPEREAKDREKDKAPEKEPEREPEKERPARSGGIPVAVFTAAGIPEDTARRIAGICGESPNLRTTYNRLRKAFGAADGRRYYQLVKKHPAERPAHGNPHEHEHEQI